MRVKQMFDYQSLPITDELRKDMETWAQYWEAYLVWWMENIAPEILVQIERRMGVEPDASP